MPHWRHFTTGTVQTVTAAMSSARSGVFGLLAAEQRAAQMRVLLVLSLQAATISDTQGPLGLLAPSLYGGDDERNAAGAAIARTAMLLVPDKSVAIQGDVYSADGGKAITLPAPPFPDVSALPALAIVAMVCAASAAAAYIATVVSESEHGIAFEQEKTKRLLNAQAAGIDTIAQHVEREKQAGKTLPFEPEERTVLHGLEQTQRDIAKERNVPLPTPFDGARDFGKALGESTSKIGQSVADSISLIAPIAVIGGLIWLAKK